MRKYKFKRQKFDNADKVRRSKNWYGAYITKIEKNQIQVVCSLDPEKLLFIHPNTTFTQDCSISIWDTTKDYSDGRQCFLLKLQRIEVFHVINYAINNLMYC